MVVTDSINHPSHYTRGSIETIEVIEDWQLDFCLGNTVKYISRAGHKDPAKEIEDLKKARWYLDRRISQLGGEKPRTSLEMVREFHERFGQVVNETPTIGDDGLNALRISLLEEELTELSIALDDRNPVAVLDALTDLQYVLDGAYLSLGFARYKDAALAEVHRSNLSKLSADGKPVLREDGKILKPPGYSPPDLDRVLAAPASVAPMSPAGAGAAPINRLGRACTDCGAGDGECHGEGCAWTEVVR